MNVYCSSSAISWMHRPAATAASLLGLNVAALGLGAAGVWRVLSHKCSRGYRCCTARSSCDLPMCSLAALTTSSLPTISCLITPNGHNSPGLALPKRVSGGWSLLWLVVPRCFAFLECGESCVQIYDSTHTPVQVSAAGISATRYWSHSSLSLRRQTLLSVLALALLSLDGSVTMSGGQHSGLASHSRLCHQLCVIHVAPDSRGW